MKKTCMCLVLMVAAICLPFYVQAGIEDLKISIKPIMNEYSGNKVELSVKNTGNKLFRGNIRLMVPEQWGPKPAGIVSFNVKPQASIKKSWTFANALKNPYNKYTIRVKIASGNSVVSAVNSVLEKQIVIKGKKSSLVNLGEPRSSKDIKSSIFGTMTHFGQRGAYNRRNLISVVEKIEKAGIKWVHDEVKWNWIEQEKGVLKIPAETQGWIDACVEHGIDLQIGLVYGNKFYDPKKDFEAFKKAYANYCAFAVKELKGKVKVWEIWNEPGNFAIGSWFGGIWNAVPEKGEKISPWMDKYCDLVIAAARAMRKADPDAVIITNPGNPPAVHRFLNLLKERNAVDVLDGISIHPYCYKYPPEITAYGGALNKNRDKVVCADADHSFSSLLRLFRERMKSVGMNPDNLYSTEFGYLTIHRTKDDLFEGVSDSAQAKYLARQFILHQVYNMKLAIQFEFLDTRTLHSFGLLRKEKYNYAPKPSYFAVQRVCSLLSSPVEFSKSKLSITVMPEKYFESKNWKRFDAYMIWDGEKVESLNRVEKYLFTNGDKELILVLWNAIRADEERKPLLTKNIILGTSEYTNPLAIDILTGETYDIKSEIKGNKTFLKDVIVPDYPIVIKMFKK